MTYMDLRFLHTSMPIKGLASLLDIPQYSAVGIVQCLWLSTAIDAWRGDIGKYSNQEIAWAVFWKGDPDQLINALLDCRFLEQVEDNRRLIVSDWYEVCDKRVKKKITQEKSDEKSNFTRRKLSRRTRFEVFKRDLFTCQYCGQKPPGVKLEVDHIIPIAKGGNNKMKNLTTSCEDCNRGKSDVLLEERSR